MRCKGCHRPCQMRTLGGNKGSVVCEVVGVQWSPTRKECLERPRHSLRLLLTVRHARGSELVPIRPTLAVSSFSPTRARWPDVVNKHNALSRKLGVVTVCCSVGAPSYLARACWLSASRRRHESPGAASVAGLPQKQAVDAAVRGVAVELVAVSWVAALRGTHQHLVGNRTLQRRLCRREKRDCFHSSLRNTLIFPECCVGRDEASRYLVLFASVRHQMSFASLQRGLCAASTFSRGSRMSVGRVVLSLMGSIVCTRGFHITCTSSRNDVSVSRQHTGCHVELGFFAPSSSLQGQAYIARHPWQAKLGPTGRPLVILSALFLGKRSVSMAHAKERSGQLKNTWLSR